MFSLEPPDLDRPECSCIPCHCLATTPADSYLDIANPYCPTCSGFGLDSEDCPIHSSTPSITYSPMLLGLTDEVPF